MQQSTRATNWAGNVTFRASAIRRPGSVPELQRLVATTDRIRALGTAHSFSRVADTTGELVSIADLPPRFDLDPGSNSVTVSAGLRYSDVAPRLDAAGFALANLASLPHISVAGAVATGTHGSGNGNQCLAAAVRALEVVTGAGDLVWVSRESDPGQLAGLVVALGACGVVTSLTLDLVPGFEVRQWVYEQVPFAAIAENFGAVCAAGYSVSVFTGWRPDGDRIWVKSTDPAPPAGALASVAGSRDPAASDRRAPADCATPQGRRARPLVRTAAAFPAGVHPQCRRGAAVGVPDRAAGYRGGPVRPGPGARRTGSGRAGIGDPHGCRRRPVAEPGLPARQHRLPLHLDPGRSGGRAGAGQGAGRAGAVRAPAALGQDQRHPGRDRRGPLPATG